MARKVIAGVIIALLISGVIVGLWSGGFINFGSGVAGAIMLKPKNNQPAATERHTVQGYVTTVNEDEKILDIATATATIQLRVRPETKLIHTRPAGEGIIDFTAVRPGFFVEAIVDSANQVDQITFSSRSRRTDYLGKEIFKATFPLAGFKVSSDGSRIALLGVDYENGLSFLSEDGQIIFIEKTASSSVSWSPDGKQLAFINRGEVRGSDEQLCLFSFDRNLIKVLKTVKSTPQLIYGLSHIAWSPDGAYIAYGDWVGVPYSEGYTQQVFLISPDGRRERLLVTDFVDTSTLNWSPNSGSLLLNEVLNPELTDALIKQVDAATGTATDMTSLDKPGDLQPIYSPDGLLIAFHRKDGLADTLWLMDHRGQSRRQVVTEADQIGGICWLDNSRVVYCKQDAQEIIGVNLLNGQKVFLTRGLEPFVLDHHLYYLDRSVVDGPQHLYKMELETF